METMLGKYEVEKVSDSKAVAYRLHGSRGSVIRLVRNASNASLLFAVNKSGNTVFIQGSSWFTDESGCLRPVAISRG